MSTLLQTHALTRRFGGVIANNKVNFTLETGELRCLIGPNGAGKSTFLKMLCGMIPASEGTVTFNGTDITRFQPHQIARLGVGTKTQIPSLFDGLTVTESVAIGAARDHLKADASLIANELIERLDLSDIDHLEVGELAHGQRQWVELAMVLSTKPKLILLDEPTAGMTKEEVVRTAAILKQIKVDHTLIVVEHDMQFVRRIASNVTVFHQGEVLVEGPANDILRNEQVRAVYLGKKEVTHA